MPRHHTGATTNVWLHVDLASQIRESQCALQSRPDRLPSNAAVRTSASGLRKVTASLLTHVLNRATNVRPATSERALLGYAAAIPLGIETLARVGTLISISNPA